MRVSSPVGDFPFTPEHARLEAGGLLVEGRMGEGWPARVLLEPRDLVAFARLVPVAAAAALVGLALAAIGAAAAKRAR